LQVLSWARSELAEVVDSLDITHEAVVFLGWSSDQVEDKLELVFALGHRDTTIVNLSIFVRRQWEAVLAWEKVPAAGEVGTVLLKSVHQLSEDHTCGPDIHLFAIVFLHQDEFRCTVVPRRYMTGEVSVQIKSCLPCLQQNM